MDSLRGKFGISDGAEDDTAWDDAEDDNALTVCEAPPKPVGQDDLHGGDGNDYLSGGFGYDFLWGDAGDDTIYLGTGVDVGFGEEGYDLFVLHNDGAYDRISCAIGNSSYNPDEGLVVYVGDGPDPVIDPLDDVLLNCGTPVAMSTTEFQATYPDLPLPTDPSKHRPVHLQRAGSTW